jgi:Domain of unknown function (DUF4296)
MRMPGILLFLCVLFFSCGRKQVPEAKMLSSEKMQAVMWDIFQAEAYTEFYLKKDSTKNLFIQNAALQKKIFSIHQVSKEDFLKTYDYYSNHSNDMRILLDSVSAKAERQRNKMIERKYSKDHKPSTSEPQR